MRKRRVEKEGGGDSMKEVSIKIDRKKSRNIESTDNSAAAASGC